MNQFLKKLLSFLFLFSVSLILAQNKETSNNTNVNLVVFGGGEISDDLFKEFLSHSKVKNPNILIIPFAAGRKIIKQRSLKAKNIFTKLGLNNVQILDLSDREKALEAIKWSETIWIPGGSQARLRKVLEKHEIFDVIRAKAFEGYLIGGTSAGASIVSRVMMEGNTKDKATGKKRPVISYGLGLWSNAIVDQHFSQRKRLSRLDTAIKVHPDLIGVGIDESTGVVYKGKNEFSVIGKGTVTFLQVESRSKLKKTDKLKKIILKNGDSYNY